MNTPFHPDYGLTEDIRVSAVLAAELLPRSAVAKQFNIHESTLSRWVSAYREQPR